MIERLQDRGRLTTGAWENWKENVSFNSIVLEQNNIDKLVNYIDNIYEYKWNQVA